MIKRPAPHPKVEFARRLVAKLERLSADSYWAHQASGVRGSLLRALAEVEATAQPSPADLSHLEMLINQAYRILVKAAEELVE